MPEEIIDRLLDLMRIYHLLHDKVGRIEDCQVILCKRNMRLLRKYKLSVYGV